MGTEQAVQDANVNGIMHTPQLDVFGSSALLTKVFLRKVLS
jgi:hypothetical protein